MRRVLAGIGRVFVTLGVLVLLLVVYQLWGTGIYEARAQNDLASQFSSELKHQPTTTTPSGTTVTTAAPDTPTTTTTTEPPAPAPPVPFGDAVAHIVIPKVGIDKYVVEGVGVPDLRKGPGHYPTTPMPGQEGTAAIAGHRTTYGAPFGPLDGLAKGDVIQLTTFQGSFDYIVDQDPFAVDPHDFSVLDAVPDPENPGHFEPRLTLSTCNPKFSASQRLIVQAHLKLAPQQIALPPQVRTTPKAHLGDADLSGASQPKTPTIIWGFIAAVVGGLWWLLFHRHPRWTTWLVGAVPFAVVLFVFYTYLERVLPSNY